MPKGAPRRHCAALVRPGDIIGFSGEDWLSFGINILTYGIPFYNIAHVGIVINADDVETSLLPCGAGLWAQHKRLLLESTRRAPANLGNNTSGVKIRPLADVLENARGKIWWYPLAKPLRPLAAARLTHFLLQQVGKGYDAIGAFRSAGRGFAWLERCLRKEDLHSLFCSELCAAAHRHIGILPTQNASSWNPNALVRHERRRGILASPIRLR